LVAAVHAVLRGEIYVSPALLKNRDDLDDRVVELGKAALTERQLEVLQLLAEGKSMKEVAAVLDLTTRTVAFHKYRLMHNLHLKNDAEVVQYAIRQRIIFD
jgi:DNA-binding NarL/FixJ family response regulator